MKVLVSFLGDGKGCSAITNKDEQRLQQVKDSSQVPCVLLERSELPYSDPLFWAIADGKIVEDTEKISQAILSQLKKDQDKVYQACMDHQNKTCDANFFAMLMGIKAASKSGIEIKTKALDCLVWLKDLWGEKKKRISENNLSTDFSTWPDCPHTFSEVEIEAEAQP